MGGTCLQGNLLLHSHEQQAAFSMSCKLSFKGKAWGWLCNSSPDINWLQKVPKNEVVCSRETLGIQMSWLSTLQWCCRKWWCKCGQEGGEGHQEDVLNVPLYRCSGKWEKRPTMVPSVSCQEHKISPNMSKNREGGSTEYHNLLLIV